MFSDTSRFSVAVCQMTSTADVKGNLDICEHLIKSAKTRGAVMAFLPEACDFITDDKDSIVSLTESYHELILSTFKRLAQNYNMWISVGGIHTPFSEQKVRNSHLIINNEGSVVSRYNKIHVFDANLSISLCESKYVQKGDAIVPPVQTPVGNVGLAICYDLRFPEMGIYLTGMGADILTYPSAFTYETGSQHWECLLRSRAIENQRYVIAAGQTGFHNKSRRSWGHSMIVDPLGNICAQCSEGNGIAVATIDLEIAKMAQSKIPVYSHRRYDLYSKLARQEVSEQPIGYYQFGPVSIEADMVFYKTGLSVAFVNKRCIVPGHVLVIPQRCVSRLEHLNSAEVSDMFLTVQKVQTVMERIHQVSSSTLAIQDGPDAGQSIPHVHVHILPRKRGDFEVNDDIYRVLEKHDKEGNLMEIPTRSETEMKEEAAFLRNQF